MMARQHCSPKLAYDDVEYRLFVDNRVKKIQSCPNTQWRYVTTSENPSDLGSRGGSVNEAEQWWNGPPWLFDPSLWPADIVFTVSEC